MKRTVTIRFLFAILLVIVILILCWIYVIEARELKQEKNSDSVKTNIEQTSQEENLQNDSAEILAKDVLYILKLEQERVVIYHANSGEIYDKTDITTDVIPENILQELSKGIPVYSLKELYDFLENYSS